MSEIARSYGWSLGLRARSSPAIIARIDAGFSVSTVDRLVRRLDLRPQELARAVGISERTLARRRNEGRLTTEESDRLYRLARLFERAVIVFDSEDDAREWFHRPQVGLGGSSALEFARNEPGSKEVEALLGRIEHGVLA